MDVRGHAGYDKNVSHRHWERSIMIVRFNCFDNDDRELTVFGGLHLFNCEEGILALPCEL